MNAAEQFCKLVGWGSEKSPIVMRQFLNLPNLDKIQEKIAQIHQWFGRIQRDAQMQAAAKVRVSHAFVGVETGNDLSRLAASELTRIADPDLQTLFWLDWMDRKTMIYETEKESVPDAGQRGPVVILVDESGSMSGEPGDYAKAMAFYLRAQIKADKRPCLVISFAESGRMLTLPDEATPEEALKWFQQFFGGGTDFDGPLCSAVEFIESCGETNEFSKADIVMLTDGVCQTSDHTDEKVRNSCARLWVFYFGDYNRSLQHLAHKEYQVDLDNPAGILQELVGEEGIIDELKA
jgi:uncharacterized protein with von Willebrand factor type A (vWA) domain